MEKTELIQDDATEFMEYQSTFSGGFLDIGEVVKGWEITSKFNIKSLEAEVYRAKKDGADGIVKYYRGITKPKIDILEKIKGLDHPDIVNLYEIGMHKGRLFEIMEYAAGGALDSKNEDGSYKYLPIPEDEVITICKEVINAFKDCHSMGIIHRDIKPGNIYYRKPGSDIVIADFGISSVMDDSEKYHKTRTATRTSSYAAPEILCSEINYKYDYYSLGITLWELATGKEPYITENGRRLDSTYIMQLSTEGFAADNLLSTKPHLSEKLQRLIRGLLLVNPEHRWGYEQVTDHLEGKEVPIVVQQKTFSFAIGDKTCTDFEELSEAIMDKPEVASNLIFKGRLKAILSRNFPEKAKQIEEIAEEASAKGEHYNGIYKVAWTLSLKTPFKPGNGYSVCCFEDILHLIAIAPETMLPLLREKNSRLYVYLEVLGKIEEIKTIKKISETAGDAELISKALVILKNRAIKPYKLEKYKGFALDTPENLMVQEIPKDLQNRILLLISERNYEGLIYPWIDLHLKERGINEYAPKTWNELIQLFSNNKAKG
jgi:serine/threonine protein kinase